MNKREIILIGGGGHCRACIDVIESEKKYSVVGIIDKPELKDQKILNYRIIGDDNDLPKLAAKGYNFLITMGFFGNSMVRERLFNLIKQYGGRFPVIVSPTAYISKYTTIQEGTIIMHNVIVNANAKIGVNNIVNTKSLIEHDVVTGNHNHISTTSVLNGNCKLGNSILIGSGSILKQGVRIADNTIVGAGAVVVNHINVPGTYIGVPAKKA